MISFVNDYSETCHEKVLAALSSMRDEQNPGYSEDAHCMNARRMIQNLCGDEDAAVHFVSGGTQANLTVIAAFLRPHQGVVSACTGHINVHETGAVEATGHKVVSLPSADGKIKPEQIRELVSGHFADEAFEHTVQPGMVYVSQTTELGTVYTKGELTVLSAVCRELCLPLYLDGARLGYALTSQGCDLTLKDLACLCDAFTIGGTKQGALFGEAVVITQPALDRDFRYIIKQRGGMLAKGFLLGAQFEALLADNLYFRLAEHASRLAMRIRDAFTLLGVPFLSDSPSNQQFPILTEEQIDSLGREYRFSRIRDMKDGQWAVRFCTSWATKDRDADSLCSSIAAL